MWRLAYAHEAGRRSFLGDRAEKNGGATVEDGPLPTTYRVRWPLPAGTRASLVICSRTPKR